MESQVLSLRVEFYCTFCQTSASVTRRAGETYLSIVQTERDRDYSRNEWIPLRTVTDAFLALDSPDDAKQFFELYGYWNRWIDTRRNKIKWSEILAFQSLLRQSWELDFTRWDDRIKGDIHALNLIPNFLGKGYPILIFVADTVKEFLLADLCFTALSGLPAAFCARKDCGKLFQKTSKHQRKFCSTECAHLESVRQHRARMSKKRKK
jgi:hypothetical protein